LKILTCGRTKHLYRPLAGHCYFCFAEGLKALEKAVKKEEITAADQQL